MRGCGLHATLQEFPGAGLEPPQCRLQPPVYAEARPGHGQPSWLAWTRSTALQSPGTTCNDSDERRRDVHDPWERSAVEITHRAYADVVVVAPAGRLDHAVAEDFERSLMPLLTLLPGGTTGARARLRRRRVHQQRRPARADDRREAERTRGARIAVPALQPVVAEIFAISRFDSVVEVFPSVRGRGRAALAARARRLRRRARRRSHEARPLLGHARLAADRAHRPASARKIVAALRGAAGRASRRTPSSTTTSTASAFAVAGTYGGHTSCVEIETGGAGLRAVRPRQRRASVRPGGARAPRCGVAADLSRLHVARALGPHHGPAVLHAGLHPGQPHRLLRRPRADSRRRCAGSRSSRRSRSGSRPSARTSSSCTSSPARRTRSPA